MHTTQDQKRFEQIIAAPNEFVRRSHAAAHIEAAIGQQAHGPVRSIVLHDQMALDQRVDHGARTHTIPLGPARIGNQARKLEQGSGGNGRARAVADALAVLRHGEIPIGDVIGRGMVEPPIGDLDRQSQKIDLLPRHAGAERIAEHGPGLRPGPNRIVGQPLMSEAATDFPASRIEGCRLDDAAIFQHAIMGIAASMGERDTPELGVAGSLGCPEQQRTGRQPVDIGVRVADRMGLLGVASQRHEAGALVEGRRQRTGTLDGQRPAASAAGQVGAEGGRMKKEKAPKYGARMGAGRQSLQPIFRLDGKIAGPYLIGQPELAHPIPAGPETVGAGGPLPGCGVGMMRKARKRRRGGPVDPADHRIQCVIETYCHTRSHLLS